VQKNARLARGLTSGNLQSIKTPALELILSEGRALECYQNQLAAIVSKTFAQASHFAD
jgi:hypothetical protein